MKAAYDRVANELQGEGLRSCSRVAADVPGDTTALAFVGDALAKAEASIHLVGQMPGFAPEGLDQIVKLQLAKARERAEETEDRAGRPFRRFAPAPPKVLEYPVRPRRGTKSGTSPRSLRPTDFRPTGSTTAR